MKPLRIGICCYPTYGGSGVLATELGMALGRRGHQVHFICSQRPQRLAEGADNVHFHAVEARDYPVFPHTPYTLALCSTIVSVAQATGLDLVHAHYAVPHATSAWMAQQVSGGFRLITTLHGTDITLVGSHPSYLPITRHSMVHSQRLTTPSQWLRDETVARFGLDPATIEVVPNFVDTEALHPGTDRRALVRYIPDLADDEPVVVHVSNLRPVKRIDRVIEVFDRVATGRRARLLVVLKERHQGVAHGPVLRALGAGDVGAGQDAPGEPLQVEDLGIGQRAVAPGAAEEGAHVALAAREVKQHVFEEFEELLKGN
mgnify:CR=1 FL=1